MTITLKTLIALISTILAGNLLSDPGEGIWVSVCCARSENPPTFSTWEGFEVDKCATIWLIKRFVDKNARIRFYPKGETLMNGIAFDTPDARFRRYHNLSTYETMLKHHQFTDPKLVYIGRIIHDIEINIWEKKVLPETLLVQDAVTQIILKSKDNFTVMKKSYEFFDTLYENLTEE